MLFDLKEWDRIITKSDWYKFVYMKLQELQQLKQVDLERYEEDKEKIYDFFERHLEIGDIFLGKVGKNWDLEREPVDTIIIHHTSNKPWMSKERLSAIELFRLYSSRYANSKYKDDLDVYNQPVYSGHFRDGKQIFWTYHWIVHPDGSQERLLFDNETGWQSGNWGY